MLVINHEIVKENIYNYYLHNYFIENDVFSFLKLYDWQKRWSNRNPEYRDIEYADFDILELILRDEEDSFFYMTWNKSYFGNIDQFLVILDDLYISKDLSKKKIIDHINKKKEIKGVIYLFEFNKINDNKDRKNLIPR